MRACVRVCVRACACVCACVFNVLPRIACPIKLELHIQFYFTYQTLECVVCSELLHGLKTVFTTIILKNLNMTNADDSNIMEAVFSRRKYNDGVRNKLRTVNTRLRFLLSPNIFISILQSPEIC